MRWRAWRAAGERPLSRLGAPVGSLCVARGTALGPTPRRFCLGSLSVLGAKRWATTRVPGSPPTPPPRPSPYRCTDRPGPRRGSCGARRCGRPSLGLSIAVLGCFCGQLPPAGDPGHGLPLGAAAFKAESRGDDRARSFQYLIPGARIIRIKDFLGIVAEDEWNAVRALAALKTQWSDGPALLRDTAVADWMRSAAAAAGDETPINRGDVAAAMSAGGARLEATYYWPMQSHASMGPSCAVADIRAESATIWCASQGAHRWAQVFAKLLGFPENKVRMIYLDDAGSGPLQPGCNP
jgi:Molybdopterin-binding domain of aldehyde dehydrogenase